MEGDIGRVAIVGAGAVGCYYGGKLAASGENVHFLMRSDLETVRRDGLTIRSDGQELRLRDVNAAGSTAEIGSCDLVIVALKATANDALPELLPPLLTPSTAVLTLQNGLGNEEQLARLCGPGRVLGGLCFVCLNRVAHGVVEHYGHGTVSIGELERPPGDRARAVAAAFRRAGIETEVVADLALERWRKLVWNIPFNGLSIAAGGATVDQLLEDPGLERLVRELMLEVIAAAGAQGKKIPREYADFQIERSRNMGAYKPSSLIDWRHGSPVEVEAIWGEPLRRAQAAGCAVPRLDMLHQILRKLTAR